MLSNTDTYLTTRQASEAFNVSTSWLEKLRVRGDGPPYLKISPRRVLYSRAELTDWVERHRVCSTSEQPSAANTQSIKKGADQ